MSDSINRGGNAAILQNSGDLPPFDIVKVRRRTPDVCCQAIIGCIFDIYLSALYVHVQDALENRFNFTFLIHNELAALGFTPTKQTTAKMGSRDRAYVIFWDRVDGGMVRILRIQSTCQQSTIVKQRLGYPAGYSNNPLRRIPFDT